MSVFFESEQSGRMHYLLSAPERRKTKVGGQEGDGSADVQVRRKLAG